MEGNIMKLSELSKQAEELYNDFVDNYDQMELEDLIPYTDYYDLEYLDEMQRKLDMLADMDDDEMVYSTGHFDEQALDSYRSATDEDGNYIHPYNNEIN